MHTRLCLELLSTVVESSINTRKILMLEPSLISGLSSTLYGHSEKSMTELYKQFFTSFSFLCRSFLTSKLARELHTGFAEIQNHAMRIAKNRLPRSTSMLRLPRRTTLISEAPRYFLPLLLQSMHYTKGFIAH